MAAITYLDTIKDSTYGIVILGAIGSLFATILAFFMKKLVDRYMRLNKATSWTFGWMSAFCEEDPSHYPIYVTFIGSHISKILVQCTMCVITIIIALLFAVKSESATGYVFSTILLSFSIMFFMRAYSDYKLIKYSYGIWINKLDQEERKLAISIRKNKNEANIFTSKTE